MEKRQRSDPLVVFVHIPKTAGSTVNAALAKHFQNGHPHCEHIIHDRAALGNVSGQVDWISGHVPFHLMKRQLSVVTDRELRFFSILREPTSHVRSHYNWLIEIYHRGGDFYRNHPEKIRTISKELRQTDNSDPRAIARNLKKYAGLFLNTQSRSLLGSGFNWNSGQLLRHLRQYEFIATPEQLEELLSRMCGEGQSTPSSKNVAHYRFHPDIFKTPELRNFLMRNNFLDQMVYQTARSSRMRAAISPEMRSVPRDPTDKLFAEKTYKG